MLSRGREHQPVLIQTDVIVINCATDCRFAHETNAVGSLESLPGVNSTAVPRFMLFIDFPIYISPVYLELTL